MTDLNHPTLGSSLTIGYNDESTSLTSFLEVDGSLEEAFESGKSGGLSSLVGVRSSSLAQIQACPRDQEWSLFFVFAFSLLQI